MVAINLFALVAATGALPVALGEGLTEAAKLPGLVRSSAPILAERHGRVSAGRMVDPYYGYNECLGAPSTGLLPSNPTCAQNNCYRSWLNGRKGDDASGFHCPTTAYTYCCQWDKLSAKGKFALIRDGEIYHYMPWTNMCGAAGPFNSDADIHNSVSMIDDVCACTMQHKVRVPESDDYYKLTLPGADYRVCIQHLGPWEHIPNEA